MSGLNYCRRFNVLKDKIILACIEGNVPNNTRDYYINKVSNEVRRFNNDIYEIFVSTFNYYEDTSGYFSHFSVDSVDGTLYVSVRVD
jgi:hypothetical protein